MFLLVFADGATPTTPSEQSKADHRNPLLNRPRHSINFLVRDGKLVYLKPDIRSLRFPSQTLRLKEDFTFSFCILACEAHSSMEGR